MLRSSTAAHRQAGLSDPDTQSPKTHGEVLTAISEGRDALLKQFYGRGPTQAKSYYQDDLVVCILSGGFSQVEQTLLDGGRGTAVASIPLQGVKILLE